MTIRFNWIVQSANAFGGYYWKVFSFHTTAFRWNMVSAIKNNVERGQFSITFALFSQILKIAPKGP